MKLEASLSARSRRLPPDEALIETARLLMRQQYSAAKFPSLDFDNARWDLKPAYVSAGNRHIVPAFYRLRNRGDRRRKNIEPLPATFVNLIKAWVIHDNQKVTQASLAAQAARYLWGALETSGRSTDFRWAILRNRDLEDAERLMIECGVSQTSTVTFCRRLRKFIEWAQDNGIVSDAVTWSCSISADPGPSASAETRLRRLDRLPRVEVLEALGEIYITHARTSRDRLMICAIGILLVCGFRISELLTLPYDCMVSETRRGRECWGIRYWKRKGKQGEYEGFIRWLSPLGAELAKKCIHEIQAITESARRQARILEENLSSIVIPWGDNEVWLTRTETARALAIKPQSLAPSRRLNPVFCNVVPKDQHKKRPTHFLRSSVAATLQRRRAAHVCFESGSGERQSLSETLLIEFELSANGTTVSELLVQHFPGIAISGFLGATEHRSPSAFTRFGYNAVWKATGDESARHKMRTHMARHWLNTVANKAGMTAFQITLWMQRSEEQTKLYLHSASEIAEVSREDVRNGRSQGKVAEDYALLAKPQQDQFLETIREAHRTQLGTCVKSLLKDTCHMERICELNCSFFLWNTEDNKLRAAFENRRLNLKAAKARYEAAKQSGMPVQERQLTLMAEQLKQLDAMIERMREP